ncbi:TPA: hypothetical protein ACIVI6_001267, partial [Salmonella enterica subsp. diarizonae serovar 50:k:z35]
GEKECDVVRIIMYFRRRHDETAQVNVFYRFFILIAAGFSVSVMTDAQPPEHMPAAHIQKGYYTWSG